MISNISVTHLIALCVQSCPMPDDYHNLALGISFNSSSKKKMLIFANQQSHFSLQKEEAI